MLTQNDIITALRSVKNKNGKDVVELNFINGIEVNGKQVTLRFMPGSSSCSNADQLIKEVELAIKKIEGVEDVNVVVVERDAPYAPERIEQEASSIAHQNRAKKVIAVMSGKGGVGKSLMAGLLAVYLKRAGNQVGILDADVTGPSIPKMFFKERPIMPPKSGAILPVVSATGIKVMSINLLLQNEDEAIIWRGPLVGRAISQFWTDTLWGELDYLIIDLPPGTSDAPLTVMQSLPMSTVLLVTSPQDLAGLVVRKAANMAQKVGIPILGLVENMSFYKAPDSGKTYEVFGPSHAEDIANKINAPLIGRLPIISEITTLCDQGRVEECFLEELEPIIQFVIANSPDSQPPRMPAMASKP